LRLDWFTKIAKNQAIFCSFKIISEQLKTIRGESFQKNISRVVFLNDLSIQIGHIKIIKEKTGNLILKFQERNNTRHKEAKVHSNVIYYNFNVFGYKLL
jgi:hypothetical protein